MSAIPPETKDWTWTIERSCPECGFDASSLTDAAVPGLLAASAHVWAARLEAVDSHQRPSPARWSALEYAAHVRDVCRLFRSRTELMLAQTNPTFTSWDGDRAATDENYAGQTPAVVADELSVAARRWSERLTGLTGADWDRTGLRADGTMFTVRTLARYGLHEIAHHLSDVGARMPRG